MSSENVINNAQPYSIQHLQQPLSAEDKGRIVSVFNQIIPLVNAQIPSENKNLDRLCCPIMRTPITKITALDCGHIFDTMSIAHHFENEIEQGQRPHCPYCVKPSINASPIFAVQDLLEEWQNEARIPTFANFKEDKPEFAQLHLHIARKCVEGGKVEEAMQSYAMAFQYTKDVKAYGEIPACFERAGDKEKALLGYLHLARYLGEADEYPQAGTILDKCYAMLSTPLFEDLLNEPHPSPIQADEYPQAGVILDKCRALLSAPLFARLRAATPDPSISPQEISEALQLLDGNVAPVGINSTDITIYALTALVLALGIGWGLHAYSQMVEIANIKSYNTRLLKALNQQIGEVPYSQDLLVAYVALTVIAGLGRYARMW